jgi:uncharacterized protein
MNKLKSGFVVFYVLTMVLTILLAVGQLQMKIDFEKITFPQLAPAIAVFITTLFFVSSKTALNFKFGNNVLPKISIALILPIVVFGIGFLLCKTVGLNTMLTDNLIQILPLATIGMMIGAIGEEIGWRGFLQPNLEKRYSILLSSIITGLMWGFWHIGHYKNGTLFMIGFLLFTVSASIILRKILEGTNNNLIISILFHFSINVGFVVFYKNSLTDPKMILINGALWALLAIFAK